MPNLKEKLDALFANTSPFIADRDAHYESSWKQRGGPGAFFTIVRPWDRFNAIGKRNGYDLFAILQSEIDAGKCEADDGTLHACIRDLMCYMALLLVEAKQMRQAYKPNVPMQAVSDGSTCYLKPDECVVDITGKVYGTVQPATIQHGTLSDFQNNRSLPQRTVKDIRKDIVIVLEGEYTRCGQTSPLAIVIQQLLSLIDTL